MSEPDVRLVAITRCIECPYFEPQVFEGYGYPPRLKPEKCTRYKRAMHIEFDTTKPGFPRWCTLPRTEHEATTSEQAART